MNAGACVTSLAALNQWYANLTTFRAEAQNALTALSISIQRAETWLIEQEAYWRREIRAAEEDVSQAKAELRTRQYANVSGERPDCSAQEANLRRAKARLEHAEDKRDATRRWMKRLPVEARDVFEVPVRRLSGFIEGDLLRGLMLLARQITALEQYTNLRSEVVSTPAVPAAAEPAKEKS